jgi:addiction module HigA family antidote
MSTPSHPAAHGSSPLHPGQYVKESALAPKKMSVTEAAGLIGISRPGVSNFLNGKVAASPEMATRIERAFGIPAQALLDMQAAYDAAQARLRGAPSNARAYVPPFLQIKANDIEHWASPSIAARTRLSVFLRTLVHSTGVGLQRTDFPGNDDAERAGWDGYVEANEGTPWVPVGRSGWEFGTNRDIKAKADADFSKSISAVDRTDRQNTTFVFVTPRRWSGKTAWLEAAKATGQWKDVRVYDAQDLEQWLEQSLAGQTWLANEINRPSEGVRSLDSCWDDWSKASNPPLDPLLFKSSVQAAKRLMVSRLSSPPGGPTVVAADSVEEALAFLSQLFIGDGGELQEYRDRVLVFGKVGVLTRLAQGARNFIPIAFDREVERELAPLSNSMHSIVIYPRNAAGVEPHIILEPVKEQEFRLALESMGFDRDQIARYRDESGRSLTVLRRRLSNVPAVRTPAWASDTKAATSLVPFLFVGAWSFANETDKAALSLFAGGVPYEALEKECQHLVQINDAPVWSVGAYRGVVSKIDLLFAIAGSITGADLGRYFEVAELVLGEDNPALDLPDDKRWAAHIYGKSREFSAAFRKGVSETLVLLAVYGNSLFEARLGLRPEQMASQLVQKLLGSPLTTRQLEAHDPDLPTYAEAVPDTFLSIIERDLKSESPQVFGLLRPADANAFWSHPNRTGLLWALEGLSWNPKTLPRAALILARLAQVEINDNWASKPINSLQSIFRAWMPQTGANHDQRLAALKNLIERFPDVAWTVCIAQFETVSQVGSYSHKPRWRSDGYGYGEPLTRGAVFNFIRDVVNLTLNWKRYSCGMLCDLIERLQSLDDQLQTAVWNLVRSWAADHASDSDKAALREKIRVTVLSRRGKLRSKKAEYERLRAAAQAAYASLEPVDLLNKHEWLFRESWVEESMDEVHDEKVDFRKREERVALLRTNALSEVLRARGLEGIFELAEKGRASVPIGSLLTQRLLTDQQTYELLLAASKRISGENAWPIRNLVAGCLHSIDNDSARTNTFIALEKAVSKQELVQLLLQAPFRKGTWEFVDTLDEAERNAYWHEVRPNWIHESENENAEAIRRLLMAERPRAAFSCARLSVEKIEPLLLFRLLTDVAQGGRDEPGHDQLERHSIERAFATINQSPDLTLQQKASLEFTYIDALDRSWDDKNGYGIPNLERFIDQHPEQYVQALVWAYRRTGGGEDPVELRAPQGREKQLSSQGYKLIEALERIPGRDDLGNLKVDLLTKWVKTVRDACVALDRAEIADVKLGELLANAPVGDDGVWPCEPVRRLLEDIQSESMLRGARVGVFNSRGVHFRGEGGDDERLLADKYRVWANALQYSHPFVASSLLEELVKTYEREADFNDTEATIRRRLP